MYESSEPPSIIYSVLSRKDFVIVLIFNNKYFQVGYCDRFGNPPYRVWNTTV